MITWSRIIRKIDHFFHPGIGEVWMLHRVTNNKSTISHYHRWEVTPLFLERIILDYRENQYEFISLDEVIIRMREKNTFGRCASNKRFVAVTLDDGFLDNYTDALPIFEKYEIPFCVFVTPGYVLGTTLARKDDHVEMMSKSQIVELSRHPLCTIGSHTMSHPHLSMLEKAKQYDEIFVGKSILEEWIGKPVLHFASPYGDYNHETLEIVKNVGLRSHFDIWGGPMRRNSKWYLMPRKEIIEK